MQGRIFIVESYIEGYESFGKIRVSHIPLADWFKWDISQRTDYISKVCNNGPKTTIMARGNAEGHNSCPWAVITDRGYITNPL